MVRPKSDRQGKPLTIYLTPERLERLGRDPAKAIYALIDGNVVNGVMHVSDPPAKPAKSPTIPSKKAGFVCPRHSRQHYTAPVRGCTSCRQP